MAKLPIGSIGRSHQSVSGTRTRCGRYVVPGTRYLDIVPGTRYLVAGTWYQVPGTRYLVPGTWSLVQGTR